MLVVHRASYGIRRSDLTRRSGRRFRQPEIQNLGVAALGNKNIRRLDVAVDDALRMCGVQSVGNLNGQVEQDIGLDRPARNAMLQRHAVEELHGDERVAVLVINLVDGADVGMIQRRGRLGLALKTGERLLVFGNLIGEELESHKPAELHILGLVHHAHAAAAELLDDAVVRDGALNH